MNNKRIYAILLELDVHDGMCGDVSSRVAIAAIRHCLGEMGFVRIQGNLYFGDKDVNAVTCCLAFQNLAKKFPWFRGAVKTAQLLRIEENSSLLPVLE